ncbi:hypothetical protein INR49_001012 [Caranx melampygus]|nr:hypothetical protein INR49_001012 [Caranx melampygus]
MDFYINLKVSINCQVEYEEALKLFNLSNKASGAEPKRGFRPPQHCPALAQVVSRKVQAAVPEQGMVIMKEVKGTKEEDKTPPAWFTSYMEKFKDQVVREAVEKICREFSGQCCIHKPLGGGGSEGAGGGRGDTVGGAEVQQVPEVSSTLPGAPSSSTPPCSSCRGQTTGGGYQCRFYRRGDRSFRKAEKQRLKAEKRLLKAEVKEIRKQLRMERRGIQRPKRPCPLVVPAMTAAFLDENLPDGTRLRPGTKFIKYWKMRNTGTVSWSSDTKLKFMWGNLAVGSGDRWREVSVPFLQPGQVGIVSIALCAPALEGSYTSHWRLAHAGEQFGPRVWCSILVDPLAPAPMMADGILVSPCVTPQGKNPLSKDGKAYVGSREQVLMSVDQEEYYIPSVDLLTAQDLLSFELLDINIVQELESVPNNTPADMAPCMSSQGGHLQHKSSSSLALIQEETEVINNVPRGAVSESEESRVPAQEEGEDDISGTQFVCETVIRSMTLEEAPDHSPLGGSCPRTVPCPPAQGISSCVKSKTIKREDTPDSNPCSSNNTMKPPATVKASLPTPLKASLPAPTSVAPTLGPGPSSAPTLLHASAGVSTLQDQTATDEAQDHHMKSVYEEFEVKKRDKQPEGRKRERMRERAPEVAPPPPPQKITSLSSLTVLTPVDHWGSPCTGSSMEGQAGEASETAPAAGAELSGTSSANDMLCTSQTLDDEPLTPEVVAPPNAIVTPSPETTGETDFDAAAGEGAKGSKIDQNGDSEYASAPEHSQGDDTEATEDTEDNPEDPRHPGITSGLVKGALSVAASAYKALFTGQGPTQPPVDSSTQDTMMAVLAEMGFGDRLLNQRLLKKHNYNLLDVVNELVQMTDNDWYSTHY